jgi:hypothetical protein
VDLGYPNVHWYRHCTEGCEEPPLSTQGGAAPLVPWSYLSISYLVLNLHEELWVLPKTCLRSALCSILRLVCIVESLRTQPSGNPPRPPSPPPPVALVPGLCPPRPFDGTRPFPITCCLLSFPLFAITFRALRHTKIVPPRNTNCSPITTISASPGCHHVPSLISTLRSHDCHLPCLLKLCWLGIELSFLLSTSRASAVAALVSHLGRR